jgi:Family of unknown function (DUF6365)
VSTRVVFLISIEDSYGEREHAYRFGRQLTEEGFATTYVVAASMEAYFRRLSLDVRPYREDAEAMRIVDEIDPHLLVGCEYFNLSPGLQKAVAASRFPLATMDGTTLGIELNTNPLGSRIAMRDFAVPERLVHLRPCPVGDPIAGPGLHPWFLFRGVTRRNPERTRQDWDVPPGARLILYAVAPWARGAAFVTGRMSHFPHLLTTLAQALAANGTRFETIVVLGRSSEYRGTHGRTRCVELLPPDVFEDLLLGCDLVVTDNVIQTSASKALVAGIPTLALVNSKPGPPGTPLAEPYNMFPVAVQFPEGSAYYRALAPVEIGDIPALRTRLASALSGDERRGAEFTAALERLPTPAQIVRDILAGS